MNGQKKSYEKEVKKLLSAIDISIDAYRKYPPYSWSPDIIKMVTHNLEVDKKRIINAEVKFKNLNSLNYDIDAVFTFFHEGTGPAVEYFWERIGELGLGYERKNKLKKILKRGKIRGQIEFNYLNDIIVVAEQAGLATKNEIKRLNSMIGKYESGNK
ncbi:MAG: hypothetical protein ACPGVD_07425 [Flavobacteriales bacterium]